MTREGIMRQRRTVLFAVLVLLVAVQFIPVRRTNPGGGAEMVASADVAAVFERSCCDCHSNTEPVAGSWIGRGRNPVDGPDVTIDKAENGCVTFPPAVGAGKGESG